MIDEKIKTIFMSMLGECGDCFNRTFTDGCDNCIWYRDHALRRLGKMLKNDRFTI